MARPKDPTLSENKPIPLRLSEETIAQVQQIVDKTGVSQAQAIRMALAVGLEQRDGLSLSEELQDQLTQASAKMGMEKEDVARLAMAIGLEDLKMINFDLAKVVVSAKYAQQSREAGDKLVDTPAVYGASKKKAK